MGGVSGDERRARVLLSACSDPEDETVADQVRRQGAESVVAALRAGRRLPNLRAGRRLPTRAAALASRLEATDADEILAAADRVQARLVVPGDAEWPTQLDQLRSPPLALWVVGSADLRLLAIRSVAIVGARAATPYGEAVARDLAADLVEHGWAVVSGGAYGIDAAAHRGALEAGGVTACVLAGGVDVAYPRAHAGLLARIADAGALVSESPPGAPPLRPRFLSRNRIIAALTRGTVVVEAALRSGARRTALDAVALHRPLLAVPGPVTSPMSAGVHRLVREGAAILVTGADEVLDAVGDLGPDAAADPRGDRRPWDDLGPEEREVFEALSARRPRAVDDLAVRTGLPPARVMAALGALVADGLAHRHGEGWLVRRSPVPAPG